MNIVSFYRATPADDDVNTSSDRRIIGVSRGIVVFFFLLILENNHTFV